jgi:hypothetical protein
MKMIKKKVPFAILMLILTSGILIAQSDPVKNQEENKLQYQQQEQNEVKNQVQTKSEGENQIKTQTQTKYQKQSKNQNQNQERNKNQVHGTGFVDLNGDGINDNAIDSDGDGIPNGQDPDYVKPKDGTGQKYQYGKGKGENKKGNMWGPNDGTGNSGIGPKDGTGYGPGGSTGNCDGNGPKRGGRG